MDLSPELMQHLGTLMQQMQSAGPSAGGMGGSYITDEEIERMTAGMPQGITTPNPGMRYRNEATEADIQQFMRGPHAGGPQSTMPSVQDPQVSAAMRAVIERMRQRQVPMPMMPFGALR